MVVDMYRVLGYVIVFIFILEWPKIVQINTKSRTKMYDDSQTSFPDINMMSWMDFEGYTINVLRFLGYTDIELTDFQYDGGKDLVAYKDNNMVYVECKKWAIHNKVGRDVLQKLVGACIGDGANEAICITTSYFTDQAKEYAKNVKWLTLIDRNQLEKIIEDMQCKIPIKKRAY